MKRIIEFFKAVRLIGRNRNLTSLVLFMGRGKSLDARMLYNFAINVMRKAGEL